MCIISLCVCAHASLYPSSLALSEFIVCIVLYNVFYCSIIQSIKNIITRTFNLFIAGTEIERGLKNLIDKFRR